MGITVKKSNITNLFFIKTWICIRDRWNWMKFIVSNHHQHLKNLSAEFWRNFVNCSLKFSELHQGLTSTEPKLLFLAISVESNFNISKQQWPIASDLQETAQYFWVLRTCLALFVCLCLVSECSTSFSSTLSDIFPIAKHIQRDQVQTWRKQADSALFQPVPGPGSAGKRCNTTWRTTPQ